MSVPITARLTEDVVAALDNAVEAGLAPTRGAVVAAAVNEWLVVHAEATIEMSYRRRYENATNADDELIDKLAAFSVAACLADHAH